MDYSEGGTCGETIKYFTVACIGNYDYERPPVFLDFDVFHFRTFDRHEEGCLTCKCCDIGWVFKSWYQVNRCEHYDRTGKWVGEDERSETDNEQSDEQQSDEQSGWNGE